MAGDKRKGKKGVFYLSTFDVIDNEGPFAGEVDGVNGHGPSLVWIGCLRGRVLFGVCGRGGTWSLEGFLVRRRMLSSQ